MTDRRGFLEDVVYCGERQRRFTQQSPIMPDVWIRYGLNAGEQQELLLVPNWHHSTADLASAIKSRLKSDKEHQDMLSQFRKGKGKPASIAFNQNVVVANLWFDELIRAVLPLSKWWLTHIAQIDLDPDERLVKSLDVHEFENKIGDCLKRGQEKGNIGDDLEYEIVWLSRLAGLLSRISQNETRIEIENAEDEAALFRELLDDHNGISRTAAELLHSIEPVYDDDPYPLYSVNLNRRTNPSLYQSVPCIKADATARVFEVTGKDIRWAVIDSGIDAEHIAFRKRHADGTPFEQPFSKISSSRSRSKKPKYENNTRVVATYNFVKIRDLLGCDPGDVESLIDDFPILKNEESRNRLKAILELMESTPINWESLEEFLRVEHIPKNTSDSKAGGYEPGGEHGTHVAGIIGADWRASDAEATPRWGDLVGVCPEIELYDLRVLDEKGGSEFAIMSAMQFVRYLNNRRDFVAVHGVNLSFSIDHDVANYACGRTPVCEEAELLVRNGAIVVAAAGNSGRARYLTPAGGADDGFRTVSITDPGNAAAVITVGSTHRMEPHNYGVSYFSSRGPTGDGRAKPDLVAPGEKILSSIPGNSDGWLDGTSMAAPHVSGAAALIIARYPEFIGQPDRIKEILCATATDLGRERYYQGAGLLDILRAMQSI